MHPSAAEPPICRVLELRRYTLHPGRRDELIALFEREFVAPQDALGLHVLGTFRDVDQPQHFVWLRGFVDMASRVASLAAFYGGEVWRRHREAANATMIDSGDVLLLRPCDGFPMSQANRTAGPTAAPEWQSWVLPLREAADRRLRSSVAQTLLPAWRLAGARRIVVLETEATPNDFPRLPVREGESVMVLLGDLPHAATITLDAAVTSALVAPPLRSRLVPTATSPLQ